MKHKIRISEVVQTWREVEFDFPMYVKEHLDGECAESITIYYKLFEDGKSEQIIKCNNYGSNTVSMDISKKGAYCSNILQRLHDGCLMVNLISEKDWGNKIEEAKAMLGGI